MALKTRTVGTNSSMYILGYDQEGRMVNMAAKPTGSLMSYYKLEEASGNRADSVGTNTLTSHNNVANAKGKIGSSGLFTATSSTYLSHADNASLSAGTGV